MTDVPLRCVIDTNVATTANGRSEGPPMDCVAASARALEAVMKGGHLYVDTDRAIIAEYQRNLRAFGEPGPGDKFLKWVLINEWNGSRVTQVRITPRVAGAEDYEELAPPNGGSAYDPSDRKFLAVAAAHPDRPPILQSFDSKWWGWQNALSRISVTIHFLCPEAIKRKYAEKMGTS